MKKSIVIQLLQNKGIDEMQVDLFTYLALFVEHTHPQAALIPVPKQIVKRIGSVKYDRLQWNAQRPQIQAFILNGRKNGAVHQFQQIFVLRSLLYFYPVIPPK